MQNDPTLPHLRPLRRLLSNRWVVTLLGFVVFFALVGMAEAACQAIGAGYDPRIGAP